MTAAPFFIVSSGRSGTAMLHKLLSAEPDVEMHHEYMVHITQPLGVKRYLDLIDSDDAARVLAETHGAAIRYSEKAHWGDSSNKLSWLIPELAMLLPNAKFVHLVRDGRKVANSYFHKLGDECYGDRSVAILRAFVDGKAPAPPPEKKYWWPLPSPGDFRAADFEKYQQFQRIVWHWTEVNRVIVGALSALPRPRRHFVRLEDLQARPAAVRELFAFLGLAFRDEHFAAFARPHNVNRPEDRLLTQEQREQFDAIAGDALAHFGYGDSEEYLVNYG
jgi:hypothetical protein